MAVNASRTRLHLAAAVVVWTAAGAVACGRDRSNDAPREPAAVAAPASASGTALFTRRPIGLPPQGEERPMITHVAIADLDRDGLADVLVCDAFRNLVAWVRQSPR